jgi:F-type H+-transporting ATPase subunit b
MPQFQLEHFVPQLAWLALFFAILYFGIVRLTLPKVGRVMAAREDTIRTDVDTADKAKKEADELHSAYEAEIARVHGSAQASIAEATVKAAQAREAKLAEAQVRIDARLGEASAELAKVRGKAVKEIDRVAADAAREIVQQLTGRAPSEADVSASLKTIEAGA